VITTRFLRKKHPRRSWQVARADPNRRRCPSPFHSLHPHRRDKIVRLTAADDLCLHARLGAAGASPPSAERSPARAVHWPRTLCFSDIAGRRGGGPGTLDGWAAAVATGARARAYGRRLSALRTASASIIAGVRGGLWRCLVGGRFGAVVFISAWCD
jgi:hypothetical protein